MEHSSGQLRRSSNGPTFCGNDLRANDRTVLRRFREATSRIWNAGTQYTRLDNAWGPSICLRLLPPSALLDERIR